MLYWLTQALYRVLFLLPVLAFSGAAGTMNVLFALTLGSDDLTRGCWVVAAIGAAIFTALGPELVWRSYKAGNYLKAFAGLIVLAPAALFDGTAAYGFTSREQKVTAQDRTRKVEAKTKAKATRDKAEQDLAAYRDAPDALAADATVAALEKQINDARCKLTKLSDEDRAKCVDLANARKAAGRAAAKARLSQALTDAEGVYARTEDPPPQDARETLLGAELTAWLPVALLELGTLFGLFAVAGSKPPAAKPEQRKQLDKPIERAPAPAVEPAQPRKSSTPPHGPARLAMAVSKLMAEPAQLPVGLRLDDQGWLEGPQRRLSAALGVPVSRINRDLHAAAVARAIELDTSGPTTRIRLKPGATH